MYLSRPYIFLMKLENNPNDAFLSLVFDGVVILF